MTKEIDDCPYHKKRIKHDKKKAGYYPPFFHAEVKIILSQRQCVWVLLLRVLVT
jgi:hypothetical protein